MTLNKGTILEGLKCALEGRIRYHQVNVEVYLHNPSGIGEHPDILGAIEEELGKIADAEEKLGILKKYFGEGQY
jgi:hypothetical protein